MIKSILENIQLRPDQKFVADLIPPGSKVLDLGCGNGDLLFYLKHTKQVKAQGVEISEEGIMACISKGISVYQGNINAGLLDFNDGSFDYVLLGQTLQVIFNVEMLMHEMLRVARRAVVSVPNFGYWRLRFGLLLSGRMPKSRMLPYEWFNTPNIRLVTIRDMHIFCREQKLLIEKEVYVEPNGKTMSSVFNLLPNLLAHLGIFVITK